MCYCTQQLVLNVIVILGVMCKHLNFKMTKGVSLQKSRVWITFFLLKSCMCNCPVFFFYEWFCCCISLKDTPLATESNLVTILCPSNFRIGSNWFCGCYISAADVQDHSACCRDQDCAAVAIVTHS